AVDRNDVRGQHERPARVEAEGTDRERPGGGGGYVRRCLDTRGAQGRARLRGRHARRDPCGDDPRARFREPRQAGGPEVVEQPVDVGERIVAVAPTRRLDLGRTERERAHARVPVRSWAAPNPRRARCTSTKPAPSMSASSAAGSGRYAVDSG